MLLAVILSYVLLADPPKTNESDADYFRRLVNAGAIDSSKDKLKFNRLPIPPVVGDAGALGGGIIYDIINDNEASFHLYYYKHNGQRLTEMKCLVIVRGVSMKSQVRGQQFTSFPPLEATGETKPPYGSNSLTLLEPINESRLTADFQRLVTMRKSAEETEKKNREDSAAKAEAAKKQAAIDKLEATASRVLAAAKDWHDKGKKDRAIERLNDILQSYKGTPSATEAAELKKKWEAEK